MKKYLLALLLLLTACQPQPGISPQPRAEHPWSAALRVMDPVDSASPKTDITAVYLREKDSELEFRLDFLDLQPGSAQDVYLLLDTQPGGARSVFLNRVPFAATSITKIISTEIDWDLLIVLPAGELPRVYENGRFLTLEGLSTRVDRDPALDTVVLKLSGVEIPASFMFQVYVTEAGGHDPVDQTTPVGSDGSPPGARVPLLLTFRDTFAARFPAEALRSWDGAHSGPRGERHGLVHLLEAVEKYRTPVVLLDLKQPANLSGLDAMGVLPRILEDVREGLIILPENEETLFGLPTSALAYQQPGAVNQFVHLQDTTHLYSPLLRNITYIPIAVASESNQPSSEGPSLEVRRALLETALNIEDSDLLVLGGSLRDSTWGSPDRVESMLAYFASRPYLHILSEEELLDFPKKLGRPEFQSLLPGEGVVRLQHHYKNLTQPVLDFLESWKGRVLSDCEIDIDQDGRDECVLANPSYLAVFDPQGGRLSYLFSPVNNEYSPNSQLIGPSWQVAVGLSEPSWWDVSAGEAADPGAYPGAFADADDPFKVYEPGFEGDSLVFRALDGTCVKEFQLTEFGLEVGYQTQRPILTQIPLLVDPRRRFQAGWAEDYIQQNTPDGVTWGLVDGPRVRIQAEGAVALRAFNESLDLLKFPEDPDFEYPPGHTLPFPMAVLDVEMQNGYFLRLERVP